MIVDLDPVEASLLDGLRRLDLGSLESGSLESGATLDPGTAATLFEAQVASRIVDHTARYMRTKGVGYYTIGSSGHESNAAVAMALRPTDPALLHYRSGGFYMGRATQVAGINPTDDVLRGMFASVHEPISGGRHKVFGRKELAIIPQTSTISSHLPRAVGLALSLRRPSDLAPVFNVDSLVVASIGDASLNHSTAQGALNWAANAAHRGQHVPVLFVVEDNGIGISVRTPDGWVAKSLANRPSIEYATADGQDPATVHSITTELADNIRVSGRPAILHLRTVRLLGHAGSDVETAYRSASEIRADYERDPILGTAKVLVEAGECTGAELAAWYLEEREAIRARALELAQEPQHHDASIVRSAVAPRTPAAVEEQVAILAGTGQTSALLSEAIQPTEKPLTLAQTLNRTLSNVLALVPETLTFGEDIGRKGGVYGVTRGLQKTFGEDRVFDTILDEQTVLGTALGAALNGSLPIPEIQYLAYLHNAEDQIRGEAATLSFFSNKQFQNPMVVRVAGYGYQKGFGGHYHNDNSVAVLRDIPGVIVASPSHPRDAGAMLRTCVASARADGSVAVFLEPIARYHTVDLHEDGDGLWTASPTDPSCLAHVAVGSARTHGDGSDLTIITWANGLFMSLRVQKQLAAEGIYARVLDLRWLAPLPTEDMVREATATNNVLIVDETRRSGGVGEALIAELVQSGYRGAISRVSSLDTFIPLGDAANLVMVSEAQIFAAAQQACS